MIPPQPKNTRNNPLFPYTSLFRSGGQARYRGYGRGIRRPLRLRIARQPLAFQRLQIGVPARVLLAAQLVKIAPAIDAGVVQVVELDADRVVADRLDAHDADMAAAGHGLLLVRRMALHPGGGDRKSVV